MCGQRATPECIERAQQYLGLDKPIYVRYAKFLDRLVVHHSLGRSFTNRRSVNDVVLRAAPVTASLVFGGMIAWLLVSIPAGILSALRPRSLLDRLTMTLVLIGISAHPVWIGLIAAYFIGFKLHLADRHAARPGRRPRARRLPSSPRRCTASRGSVRSRSRR
jgi:peptide/nickel transport system permease protein